jgi:hypothetical protein
MEDREMGIEEKLEKFREQAIQGFVKNCYDAFDVLVKEGIPEDSDHESLMEILKASRKILALFEAHEDYEKCKVLSNILEMEFPSWDTTPDRNYIKELGLS